MVKGSDYLISLLKSYGILLVAVVALIQPWILSLLKRYFRKGKIEIYETGYPEIGYSLFGPTIGLYGTLRCINQDLFVRTIQLELGKQKDSSKHIFEWGIFRDEKITIGGKQESTLELPYAFMLSTSLPNRFNIQFHDRQVQSDMRQVINKLSEKWFHAVAELESGRLKLPESQNRSFLSEAKDPYQALYEQFSKDQTHVKAYTSLDRMCYWEAGKYALTMNVLTSESDQAFEKSWSFTLNEQEVDSIRFNVIKLLQDTCGQRPPNVQFFFALPKYEVPQLP